jgi:outer membrane protein assembly factor BamB
MADQGFHVVRYDREGHEVWATVFKSIPYGSPGAETTRDWDATAVVVDREGLPHATGGTLDVPIDFGGATQSWYLTGAYDADTGEPVWSQEF